MNSKNTARFLSIFYLFLIIFYFISCVSTTNPKNILGTKGKICYKDGTCNKGLVCEKDICIIDNYTKLVKNATNTKDIIKIATSTSIIDKRFEYGLQKMKADGSFDKEFYKYYGEAIKKANLNNRKLFRVKNMLLTPHKIYDDASYWIDIKKF